MYVCKYVCTKKCMYVRKNVCKKKCMYVCIYEKMYVSMNV